MQNIVVFITAPDEDTAAKIANAVVGERLCACVNIVRGIRSIYRWQGKIEDESEVLMMAKTTGDKFEALRSRVKEMHPYSVPEIIALPIASGHGPYLDWLASETS